MVTGHGDVKRRGAVVRLRVYIGALIEQELGHLGMAICYGRMKRRPASAWIPLIDIILMEP